MHGYKVGWLFREMADLLELNGDRSGRVASYRKAAHAVEKLGDALEKHIREGRLTRIPGIGPVLARKIEEIAAGGTFDALERLRCETPPGLLEMTRIPGVGPKTASEIHRRLGIKTVEELEAAARARRLRDLPGFGPKKEQRIITGINTLRNLRFGLPLATALPLSRLLKQELSSFPGVEKVEVAGESRRWAAMAAGVNLVASAPDPGAAMSLLMESPRFTGLQVAASGDGWSELSGSLTGGIPVVITLCRPERFGAAMIWQTGSPRHVSRLFPGAAKEDVLALRGSEEEIYRSLGLFPVPPELREDRGEVELAREGELPDLVTPADIKGELHLHTHWSDGLDTIEEMIRAVRERGGSYLAVTDHSRSLTVARGLSEATLKRQVEEVRRLNQQMEDFTVLAGIEVDILRDGSLDFPDDILAELDLVIASIHTGFGQSGEAITGRILAAMENPHVDLIAHPTGRLLGRRAARDVDVERVIDEAARTGTWLEINSSPDRLDLADEYIPLARKKGVLLSINTDSHSAGSLADVDYGVHVARRGWCRARDILNTRGIGELMELLGRPKKER